MIASLFYAAALTLTAPAPQPSFCERLAADMDMKPVEDSASPRVWQKDMFTLKSIILGRSTTVAMTIGAPDGAAVDDLSHFGNSCTPTSGGADCKISAPGVFIINFGGREARIKAEAGETAEVRVINHHVRCEQK